jgi:protein tyrosine/serine phosphatase
MLLDLLDAFDAAAQPFLLKCSGGQDRTSFAAALYLIHARGWSARGDADAQFAGWPYLHWPKKQQRWLKLFLEFAEERAQARSLRDWIAADYNPDSFKAWLEQRGLGESFRGLYKSQTPRAEDASRPAA